MTVPPEPDRTDTTDNGLTPIKRAWAPGVLSPPLKKPAAVLIDEITRQIGALGNPGTRQPFLIHGADPDACLRLTGGLIRTLQDTAPALRVARLPFQAPLATSIGGFFDALIASLSGTVALADLARDESPLADLWKDKAHAFLTAALPPTEADHPGRGVLIVVEDYDAMMQTIFDTPEKASYLRAFLQKEQRIIFLGISQEDHLDSHADERIFRLFRRFELTPPAPAEMLPNKPRKTYADAALMATAQIFNGRERPFLTALRALDWMEEADTRRLAHALFDAARKESAPRLNSLSPTRLAILQALVVGGEPATASEIASRLKVPQSRIARHITELRQDRLVGDHDSPGHARPMALRDRSLALALSGTPRELALALMICIGQILAPDEIAHAVTSLMQMPRAHRYKTLMAPWPLTEAVHIGNATATTAMDESLQVAFLATLIRACAAQAPDDMGDVRESVSAQTCHKDSLTAALDTLTRPTRSLELETVLRGLPY